VNSLPAWLQHLEDEDYQFIKRFVLASGSLKELADHYGVSYPTIRLRLDKVIDRIRTLDDVAPADPLEARVRLLVADGEVSAKLAKELLQLHKAGLKGGRK
jgi:hypothetical protein